MLKIENTETYGWEASIRGLRNPMNSWEKSDSVYCGDYNPEIGSNDHDLMMRMNVSPEQSKYRRMITVTMDVIAPLYWFKEFDTYKVGTVCNSCSTMHKIHAKEFTLDDFSIEHLLPEARSVMCEIVDMLNDLRNGYNNYDKWQKEGVLCEDAPSKKTVWNNMIQLLPTSYNQRRTIQLNYEVLSSIYRQRKNHKLDEWHTFCDWIRSLPYSELITNEESIH